MVSPLAASAQACFLPLLRRTRRFPEHPIADLVDEIAFLRDRDELHRRHHAVRRMAPAQQRLGLDDAPGRELDDRLRVELELTCGERGAEVLAELQSRLRRRLQGAREVAAAIASEPLRDVHRLVCVREQHLHVLRIARIDRDADARGYVRDFSVQQERLSERFEHFVSDLRYTVGLHEVGHDDREFIAAQPRDGVGDAHAFADPACRLDQQEIAGMVPEGVVHVLEAIEIDEHERDQLAGALRPGCFVLQPIEEKPPVGQLGERVVVRLTPDRLLGALLIRDVGDEPDATQHFTARVEKSVDREPFEIGLSGLAPVPDLTLPAAALVERHPTCVRRTPCRDDRSAARSDCGRSPPRPCTRSSG